MKTLRWAEHLEKLSRKDIIKESEILAIMPKNAHVYWETFIRVKTYPILENGEHGIYGWDLKQFLN